MNRHLAILVGSWLLFHPVLLPDLRSEEPPPDPARARAAVERLEKASPAERPRAAADLIALGPAALGEARRARDAATDPATRAALERAARWLLAAKLKPVLEERSDTGLTFDGQYADLKSEGPEATTALLALLDDEDTPGKARLAAARALADMGDPGVLPELRRLEADPLLHKDLREEARTLMAILGDTSRIDRRIQDLAGRVEKSSLDPGERYEISSDLANLYYRIRQYPKAIECYHRMIAFIEAQRRERAPASQRRALDSLLALTCYNLACSLSLNKDLERAKKMVRRAVELDPLHLKNLENDGDLRNLRESPGYREFRAELEKPLEKKSI